MTRICVNFTTVYNDTLVEKGLRLIRHWTVPNKNSIRTHPAFILAFSAKFFGLYRTDQTSTGVGLITKELSNTPSNVRLFVEPGDIVPFALNDVLLGECLIVANGLPLWGSEFRSNVPWNQILKNIQFFIIVRKILNRTYHRSINFDLTYLIWKNNFI